MSDPTPPAPRDPAWLWIRNSFAAGVAIVLPFAVTAWIIWSFVTFVDARVVPLMPAALQPYTDAIPGAGVVAALAAITLVGALAANLVGAEIVRVSERLVSRLPLVRSIYGGSKQIFKQIAAPDRTSFQEAVLVPFPSPGAWAIGFITNDTPDEGPAGLGADIVAVYVPQAPVPTSGFLLYLPRHTLRPLSLAPEEALKRVISLGIIKREDAEPAPGAAPAPPPKA